MTEVRAPMAGKVIEISVQTGATVAAEDELIILESMKMEIPINAPVAGTIHELCVGVGDTIQDADLLVRLA